METTRGQVGLSIECTSESIQYDPTGATGRVSEDEQQRYPVTRIIARCKKTVVYDSVYVCVYIYKRENSFLRRDTIP